MVGIVIFLAMTLVACAQVQEDGKHFFDINNSNALRGFWCLIVVLVHIPVAHQNRIQDMIGSFAYLTHELVFRLIDKWIPSVNSGIYIVISLLITVIVAVIVKCISQYILVCVNKTINGE